MRSTCIRYSYRGTLEWRCFESTLHAGVARANITLALAISAQAINQTRALAKKRR